MKVIERTKVSKVEGAEIIGVSTRTIERLTAHRIL